MRKRKPQSQETKDKIRKALLGRKRPQSVCDKMSKASKGKKKSKEFVENLRKVRTGWKFSDETKKKISKKLKGNKNAVGKTYKHTEESKKKIGEAGKGREAWNRGLKGFGAGRKNPNMPKGKDHWSYIHDRSKIKKSEKKHLDVEYKVWVRKVKDRDKWKCKLADTYCKGRLEAHHILNWIDYPASRYNVYNGITLCQAHHPRGRAKEKRLIPVLQELVPVLKD